MFQFGLGKSHIYLSCHERTTPGIVVATRSVFFTLALLGIFIYAAGPGLDRCVRVKCYRDA